MSTSFAEVAATLRNYPNGLTATEVAYILNIGRQTASNRLSRMAAYGHVEKLHHMNQKQPVYRRIVNV